MHTTVRPTEALRADHDALLAILDGLTPAQWAAPSGCPGWSTKDLVAHMAGILQMAVDRSVLPGDADLNTEAGQDAVVAARRDWGTQRVLDDYRSVAPKAIEALAGLAHLDDLILDLGALGTYPAPVVPTSIVFDHYTHIRLDLLAPRGAIEAPAPASDELRLTPTVDWIIAAMPQQSASAFAALAGQVTLELTGPGGRTCHLRRDGISTEDAGPDPLGPSSIARVRCTTHDLVRWATGRATWAEAGVEAEGDAVALATLERDVHVF